MAIVNLKEILIEADKGNYGVGAFNTLNLEMTKGILEAAEEEKSPVIIQIAELLFPYMPDWEGLTVATLAMAKKAKIPVTVHLDHGMTFNNIVKAMYMGLSGVMIDGSHLSFEENTAQTREIVKIAHALGIPVEAELGTVPGEEGVYSSQVSIMTEVHLVDKFVDMTGIDALAVCIGNAHGNHIKTPCLDIGRLKDINAANDIPLVLHGGSGLTDEDFRNCVKHGINKVNIFTDLCAASINKLNGTFEKIKEASYPKVIALTTEAVKQEAARKMRLFGSSNRA